MTDVELDERVTTLEESDGGDTQNSKIIFCFLCFVSIKIDIWTIIYGLLGKFSQLNHETFVLFCACILQITFIVH